MTAKRVNIISLKMVKEYSILYDKRKLESPEDVYNLTKDFLEDFDREKILLICVNSKLEPTNIQTISIGALDASATSPREVFKTAILSNSKSIFLAHNHPSGNCSPSGADIEVTRNIAKAGEILDIKLIDHIIIGNNTFISLKTKGLF